MPQGMAETTSGRRAFRLVGERVRSPHCGRVFRRRAQRSSRRQLIRREPIVERARSAGPSKTAIGKLLSL